jgi:predicted ATPase
VEPARLTELRLTDFKSFHDEVLPLGRLTVLIGGNAAGKSNALDGMYALARLAQGMTLRQALDGTPRAPSPIRGGSEGCAPIGSNSFELGCVAVEGDAHVSLTVEIRTGRELALKGERLESPDHHLHYVPPPAFRAPSDPRPPRLRTAQLGLFNDNTPALFDAPEHTASRSVTSALLGVFPLDPDPQLIRQYAFRDESRLSSDGSNLSSVLVALRDSDPGTFRHLEELTREMTSGRIDGLDFVETEIGDVQLLLKESIGAVPARLASDGTLRFIAFATALLTAPGRGAGAVAERLIVIEEIERGLYPAQARLLLELMDRELESRAAAILLTTHSPALLSALPSGHHPDVLVCSRDAHTGHSCLTRLTELPGYVELLAAGGLGEAVSTDGLVSAQSRQQGLTPEFLAFLESM